MNTLTGNLYVIEYSTSRVKIVDPDSGVVRILYRPDAIGPAGITVNSNTNLAYVSYFHNNKIGIIDEASNDFTNILDTPGLRPHGLAIDEATNRLYVTEAYSNDVAVFDANNLTLIGRIPVGTLPLRVAVNPNTRKVYVGNCTDGTVSVISGMKVVGSPIAVGGCPDGIVADFGSNRVLVANSASNSVQVIESDKLVETVPVNQQSPRALDFNPITHDVYVANTNSHSVSVLRAFPLPKLPDDPLYAAGVPIPVGQSPQGVTFDASTGRAYVVNTSSATVSVLRDHCADSDGDALCDEWESNGLDTDRDGVIDLDLPSLGASPNRKDLFVEVDFMTGHAFLNQSFALVQRAFARAPEAISLHIQLDEEVPHQHRINPTDPPPINESTYFPVREDPDRDPTGETGCPLPSFDTLKAYFFGRAVERQGSRSAAVLAAKRLVFRYALIANQLRYWDGGRCETTGNTGMGELPGNDFIVTLGHPSPTQYAAQSGSKDPLAGRIALESGTFMHELGHNLGLRHGGIDNIHCKPNYLSVMNYTRQTEAMVSDRPLDYSRQRLNDLDETGEKGGMNEAAGIGGPDGLRTVFENTRGHRDVREANDPLDWNGDDDMHDSHVVGVVRVRIEPCPGVDSADPSSRRVLRGQDDWSKLRFSFHGAPDFADGAHLSAPDEAGNTVEAYLEAAKTTDADGDGSMNFFDNCPSVPNPDQANTDGDPYGDLCDDDDDNDGLSDEEEASLGTDPLSRDSDGDGVEDPDEIAHQTDPVDADSDGDLFGDGTELAAGSDPWNPFSFPTPAGPVTLLDPPPIRENPLLDPLPPLA